jgi:hypothetical protein
MLKSKITPDYSPEIDRFFSRQLALNTSDGIGIGIYRKGEEREESELA